MAKSFNATDIAALTAMHGELIRQLSDVVNSAQYLKTDVRNIAEAVITLEIRQVMADTPIEDLIDNQDDTTVKSLRQQHFMSAADVAAASISALASIPGINANYANMLKRKAESIAGQIRRIIKIKLKHDDSNVDVGRLIHAVAQYRQLRLLADESQALISANKREIDACIESLRLIENRLKWLFSSKNIKQQVAGAYDKLAGLLYGQYGKDVKRISAEADRINATDMASAWTDFENNPAALYKTLGEVCPGVFDANASYDFPREIAARIKNVDDAHRIMYHQLTVVPETLEAKKNEIITTSDKLVSMDVMRVMKATPVEEIISQIGGTYVKALHDNGYQSVADVAVATGRAIADIPEIGWIGVKPIKSEIDNINKIIKGKIKIKISAENKTAEALSLINSVSQYKLLLSIETESDHLLDYYKSTIKGSTEKMYIAGSGFLWLCASEQERWDALDTYTRLVELRDGDYGLKVKRISEALDRICNTGEEPSWQDFLADTTKYTDTINEICPGILGDNDDIYVIPDGFTSKATALIATHRSLLWQLSGASGSAEGQQKYIKQIIDNLLNQEIIRILRDTPIGELREKSNLHLDTFCKNGYRSIADVAVMSAPSLYNNCVYPNEAPRIAAIIENITADIKSRVKIKISTDDKNDGATRLIYAVSQYRRLLPLSVESKELLDTNKNSIEEDIKNLSIADNGLKWLCATRAQRQRAMDSYVELDELRNGQYAHNIYRILDQVSHVQYMEETSPWDDFARDAAGYYKIIEEICPGILGNEDEVYDYPDGFADKTGLIITEHNELIQQLSDIADSVETQKNSIAQATDRLLSYELATTLKDMPIEELSRVQKGLRIKALRDAGYQNIAAVADVSPYRLCSVPGIGDNMGKSIKDAANTIVSELKTKVKIRISADNRTWEATNLVCAISQYRRLLQLYVQSNRLLKTYRSSIDNCIDNLNIAGSGLKWFFSSRPQRQTAINAYIVLTQLMDGAYGSEAKHILNGLAQLHDVDAASAWDDFIADSIGFFNILEDICPGVLGGDGLYGLPEDLAKEIEKETIFPNGLLCTLFLYQKWGVKYILHQGRVLLGDEMGLGKTVQSIAAMVSLRNTGATHFVVVCPASVITNWCREIQDKSKLDVFKVYGNDRSWMLRAWLYAGGVAVTTYETANYFILANDFRFTMLVVDEAHYIKNPGTKRASNIRRISAHADRMLFLTGTALENNVDEMIELIRCLRPDMVGKLYRMASISSAPQFREAIAPVYFRRKRADVLNEIPDLIESNEWCTMGDVEMRAYEHAVLSRNYAQARRVSWNVSNLKYSSKATRLLEIVDEAAAEGRKVIVFSFFLDTISKVVSLLGDRCGKPITGAVNPRQRQEIIDEFNEAGSGQVLVAQIQSGGIGLNIQSASVVVICEPQLKPSIENQAISRAYRMGQARNVLVYRLLCEESVDERITAMLKDKQEVFDAFADKSVAANQSLELDERTLGNIIQDEIDRINAKYSVDE